MAWGSVVVTGGFYAVKVVISGHGYRLVTAGYGWVRWLRRLRWSPVRQRPSSLSGGSGRILGRTSATNACRLSGSDPRRCDERAGCNGCDGCDGSDDDGCNG